MNANELPFGTQFSPEQISLRRLLELAQEYSGKTNKEFVKQIAQEFFAKKASPEKLAGNTSISLKSYGLVTGRNTIEITDVGRNLLSIIDDEQLKKEFAKHILLNLNGLILVETLRRMYLGGDSLTNANINISLIHQGFQLQQTSNNVQVMKLWLGQAGIIVGDWKINEAALKELLGIESDEIALFKELSPEQYYFLLALCNAASNKPLVATDVRNLATASYNIDFDEKAFVSKVIRPLQDKKLIVAQKTTGGRGAKPYMVELTEKTKREVVEPLLTQFKDQVGNALTDAYCKTFSDLRSEIDSENTYVKGLALEAFAIKVMRIIGLDFIRTRYRDIQIGGAEVDVLFDSTRLLYSRWQVQCKNTSTVTIDMVAKEVGLSHMLKSNAIVMMTTGHLTSEAKKYARRIMEDMNLCILMLEKEDVDCIISNPTSIVDIFNQQSEEAKKIKILHEGES
ncbi:restriction endonuclease [uncultured Subdoligranulum sp.]|uniref:restriction endonuclease n=1 Tax=uncultured Subdoligranulum sp. TaxID=512298 RepID=UPI0025DCC02A|nr:restriction endonuclease [uncultured Subdoligranulum sp.]